MKCANSTDASNEINLYYFYEGDILPEYLLLTGDKYHAGL
jgi:hypothetical protein